MTQSQIVGYVSAAVLLLAGVDLSLGHGAALIVAAVVVAAATWLFSEV